MSNKISPSLPIALFDSGAGGIGVLQEVEKLLGNERLLYFGDAANAPYGEKPKEVIRALVVAHGERLLASCKALVLACNTATAVAADALRDLHPDRIIVGIEPALSPAALSMPHPKILVLATAATLHEARFAALLRRFEGKAEILAVAAPEIVTLVEGGKANAPEMDAYLSTLLSPYLTPPPDAVVLGCTHFPFARAAILRVLGDGVLLFDGARGTARRLAARLAEEGLLADPSARGSVCITASDPTKLPLYRALYRG